MKYFVATTAILIVISLSIKAFPQSIEPSSLLGDWQTTQDSKKLEFNFINSAQVIVNSDFIKNKTCPFKVENIQGQNILLVAVNPNCIELKLFLWINSPNEIKLLTVDALNYKDPMKQPPSGKEPECVIMKKQKAYISG